MELLIGYILIGFILSMIFIEFETIIKRKISIQLKIIQTLFGVIIFTLFWPFLVRMLY
jgi:hypothetical protein